MTFILLWRESKDCAAMHSINGQPIKSIWMQKPGRDCMSFGLDSAKSANGQNYNGTATAVLKPFPSFIFILRHRHSI